MGNPKIDHPGLFYPGNNLNGVANCRLSFLQRLSGIGCLPQGIGTNNTNTLFRNILQSLTEATQTVECPLTGLFIKAIILIKTCGKTYHLPHVIDNLEMVF